MSDKVPALLMKEPHVTFAMGTMVQPLSGFDTITGLDLEDFRKLNGGFRYLQGGPLVNDRGELVAVTETPTKNAERQVTRGSMIATPRSSQSPALFNAEVAKSFVVGGRAPVRVRPFDVR